MAAKPYPIYDPAGGLDLGLEPWLTPDKALKKLQNCRYYRGRIQKRGGYAFKGDVGTEAVLPGVAMPWADGRDHIWSTGYAAQFGATTQAPLAAPVSRAIGNVDGGAGSPNQGLFYSTAPDTAPFIYDWGNGTLGAKNLTFGAPYVRTSAVAGTINGAFTHGGKMVPGSLIVFDADTDQTITFDAQGSPTGDYDPTGYNYLNLASKTFTVTFASPVVGSVAASARFVFAKVQKVGVIDGDEVAYTSPSRVAVTLASGRGFANAADRIALIGYAVPWAARVEALGQVAEFADDGSYTGDVSDVFTIDMQGGEIDFSFIENLRSVTISVYMYVYESVSISVSGPPTEQYDVQLPAHFGIRPGTFSITDAGSGQSITFDANGVVSGDFEVGAVNVIDHDAGRAQVTFDDPATGAVTAEVHTVSGVIDYDTGEFHYYLVDPYTEVPTAWFFRNVTTVSGAPNRIMRLIDWYPSAGGSYLIAITRNRILKWDTVDGRFEDLGGADVFTGTINDPFTYCVLPVVGKIVLANGVDKLKTFDGTTVANVAVDWGVAGDNIDAAKIVLFHRNRLLLLATKEGGTWYGQRWRCTTVDPNPTSNAIWSEGRLYGDAPTDEQITWAMKVADEIIVGFENSVWWLEWRDDYREPFRWRPMSDLDGAASRHAGIVLPGPNGASAMVWGRESLFSVARGGAARADAAIPDYVSDHAGAFRQHVYAHVCRQQRAGLWSHPDSPTSAVPDTVLVFQYDSQTWAIYKLPFNTWGKWQTRGDRNWDQVDGTWEQDTTFDDHLDVAGFPATLAADTNMRVWEVFGVTGDDGEPVEMVVQTASLNPFRGSERTATALVRCPYVDLIGVSGHTVTLKAYRDFETVPWLVQDVLIEGVGEVGRGRVTINMDAGLHRFEVVERSSNRFALDAIIPWFEDAGTVQWEEMF